MKSDIITSRDNPKVKHVVKLASSAHRRAEEGRFVCEGLRLCRDAALNSVVLSEVYYTGEFKSAHDEDFGKIISAGREAFEVSNDVMKKMSDTVNPQGVLAICECPVFDITKAEKGFYVGLENIANPSNLGAIARSAEAFGAAGLILGGKCCDPYSPKSLRAGMGALLRIPIYTCDNFRNGLSHFRSLGAVVYASVVDSDAKSVTEVEKSESSVLIIGNEANGIESGTAKCADYRITIPMRGRAESLNAAAAAAVLIWEFCK